MKKAFVLFFLILFTASVFAMGEAPKPPEPPKPKTVDVKIDSLPQGRRIEINNDFIGETPMVIQMGEIFTNDWHWYINGKYYYRSLEIIAYPKEAGESTQTKYFEIGHNTVPNGMFFDMRLRNVPLDININK
jgi:hypothetical protein